ncbi:MAG: relaxase/mobilization nuclease domain-containing protein [Pseudomonadota bacterium]
MAASAMSARDIQKRNHEAEQDKLQEQDPEHKRQRFKAPKKGFNHVFHFSLSWSGEKEAHTLTREEMTKAAKDALKHLDADHLQALIVAHESETNPHVHVMLNRINPDTGLTETPESNSQRRLSAWALEYEKQRGYILCPQRQDNAKRRHNNQRYSYEDLTPQEHRARLAAAAAIEKDPKAAKTFAAEQKKLDKVLSDASKDMARRHKSELDSMFVDHKRRKAAINRFADQNVQQSTNRIRDDWTPRHDHLRDVQKQAIDAAIDRESSLFGKAVNAREAIKAMRDTGWEEERGLLGSVANLLWNSAGRIQALERKHQKELREQEKQRDAEIARSKQLIQDERKTAIHENYERFLDQKADIAETQAGEKLRDDQAWQKRGLDRQAAWKAFAAERNQQQDTANNLTRKQALARRKGAAQDQFEKAGLKDAGGQDENEDSDGGLSESAKAQADAFKHDLAQSTGRGQTYEEKVRAAKERYAASKEQDNAQDQDFEQDE